MAAESYDPAKDPLYRQVPLDSEKVQTRVFKLKPSKDWESRIEGTLKVIDLEPTPSEAYKALSYTWGGVLTTQRGLW